MVAAAELEPAALAWATELADKAPLALRYTKQALNGAMEQDMGSTIAAEARLQKVCIDSEDAKEGVTAFMEKRSPRWQGR